MLSARQVKSGDTITVLLIGQLVHEHTDIAHRAFRWAVEDAALLDGPSAQVVINMDQVTAVDAAGVALLTDLLSQLTAVPVPMVLARTAPNVRHAIEQLGGARLLDTEPPLPA